MPNKTPKEVERLLSELTAIDDQDGWYDVLERATREIQNCRRTPAGNYVYNGYDFRVGLSNNLKPYSDVIAAMSLHNVSLCPSLRLQRYDSPHYELLVTCFEHSENFSPIHVSQFERPLAPNAKSKFESDVRGMIGAGYVNAYASVDHAYWYVNPDRGTIVFDGWVSFEKIGDSFRPNEVFDRYQELFEELQIGSALR